MSSLDDPSWAATRDDLRRLAWVLGLVWLALLAFTALAQRYLGWRLAAGLIGGAGLLFTLGLLLVAAGSVMASMLERRWAARPEQPPQDDTEAPGEDGTPKS
jgi:membrane protein implicated in regulation of membrane protease activity